jgi:hypothetical protein
MKTTRAVMIAGFLMYAVAGRGVDEAHAENNWGEQWPACTECGKDGQWCTETACPQGCHLAEMANGTMGCQSGPKPEPDFVEQSITAGVGGSLSSENLTLTACIEALFVGRFSAQVCGSGRGLLLDKRDTAPELTHYRVRLRLARASRGRLWLMPIVQAGMSELRVGAIDAGYLPGRGSARQLAAGPGLGVALQLLWPLGKGLELVGDIHLEAAWIPRADELVLPQETLQPSLGATIGIGF